MTITICFVWPFKTGIFGESLEFYNALKRSPKICLTDKFDEADFLFFMMDIRNCMNLPYYNKNDMDSDILDKIINHTHYSKEVIIDYNDFIDTRGVPSEIVPLVKKYFKRSVVDKNNMSLIKKIYFNRIIY